MSVSVRSRWLVATLSIAAVAAACSGAGGSKSITVTDAWVRITTPDVPAVGYLVITNSSSTADAFMDATSPDFKGIELDQTDMPAASSDAMGSMAPSASPDMGGMMGMEPVDSIPVPANGSVSLQPGGYHLMLMDPTRTLAVGDTVQLHLIFRDAGTITVSASVKGV